MELVGSKSSDRKSFEKGKDGTYYDPLVNLASLRVQAKAQEVEVRAEMQQMSGNRHGSTGGVQANSKASMQPRLFQNVRRDGYWREVGPQSGKKKRSNILCLKSVHRKLRRSCSSSEHKMRRRGVLGGEMHNNG